MTTNTKWLRCKVQRGMFTRERAVQIELSDGRVMFAFVPASDVEEGAGTDEGRVRVRFVSASDGCWVLLPAENPNPVPVKEFNLVG